MILLPVLFCVNKSTLINVIIYYVNLFKWGENSLAKNRNEKKPKQNKKAKTKIVNNSEVQ